MNEIKAKVRERYAAAVTAADCCAGPAGASGSSCCAGASTASTPLGCGRPLRHAQLLEGETVLDLGSGSGLEVLAAARRVGPTGRAIGVDLTPEMIEAARARASEQGVENTEFLLADIEALPLTDGSVDVIVSNCVVNLAPDKALVFREMFRVLKPGGRFSISDMVTHGPMPRSLRDDAQLWTGCVSGAAQEDEYIGLVRQAGFTQVEIKDRVRYGELPDERSDRGSGCTLWSVTLTAVKPQGATGQ